MEREKLRGDKRGNGRMMKWRRHGSRRRLPHFGAKQLRSRKQWTTIMVFSFYVRRLKFVKLKKPTQHSNVRLLNDFRLGTHNRSIGQTSSR
jgi:hypothetical protein